MSKLYKKIENWIWIILLIGALIYFHWLVESLHFENIKLKEAQKQFNSEVEEKYERNRQLQTEIQAQLNEATQSLLRFLQIKEASESLKIEE